MDTILKFCAGLPERFFAKGETVLEYGITDNTLYILIEGEFEVSKNDTQINTQSEPGAVFGEISVLLDMPHMATVTALKASRAYEVKEADKFLASSNQNIAYYLANMLAKRLKNATDYLVDIKSQYEDQQNHFGMIDDVLESLIHHQDKPSETGSDRHPDATI